MNRNTLNGGQICSLYTRFFYSLDQLCYRVVMTYGEEKALFYEDFEDYLTYQQKHTALVEAMQRKSIIPNTFLALK